MHSPVDLKNIPFSRYGSYIVVSDIKDKLFIRDVRRGDLDAGIVFELVLGDKTCKYQVAGDETELILTFEDGSINMIMPDDQTLRIQSHNIAFELKMKPSKYDNYYLHPKGYYEICSYALERRFGLHLHAGHLTMHHEDHIISVAVEKDSNLVIEGYKVSSSYQSEESFDEDLTLVKKDYEAWYSNLTCDLDASSRLAAYITWSNMVHDEGCLNRYAMYMSMNWMTNIWSWDNCFGAIALAKELPNLAYDQYIFFKDLQDPSGMLPDYANTVYASYASAKPPIYGWAYAYMMKKNPVFREDKYLKEVYEFVSKITEFWLNERSYDGMPYYTHGNESGWDNGTNFSEGVPLAGPDLLAFLINQIDFLIEIGNKLSYDTSQWVSEVNRLVEQLLSLWHKNQFRPYLIHEKRFVLEGDSLQNYIPILVGDRLPQEIRNILLDGLLEENRFVTSYGLATESITSDLYRYNGYWQGPIWAPTMLIFIDALRSMDESISNDLAEKFLSCIRVGGMAENFDPLTGEGLVDPSFAWTSSVYLTLMDEYKERKFNA